MTVTLHDQYVNHFAIDDRTARSAPWSLKPNVKPLAVAKDCTTNVSYLDALSSDVCILLATVHL